MDLLASLPPRQVQFLAMDFSSTRTRIVAVLRLAASASPSARIDGLQHGEPYRDHGKMKPAGTSPAASAWMPRESGQDAADMNASQVPPLHAQTG
jgi:hypothetical protein